MRHLFNFVGTLLPTKFGFHARSERLPILLLSVSCCRHTRRIALQLIQRQLLGRTRMLRYLRISSRARRRQLRYLRKRSLSESTQLRTTKQRY